MKWSPTVAGCSEASGLLAGCRFAGASLRESFAGSTPRGAGRERPGEAGSAAPLNLQATVQRQRRDGGVPLAHGMSLSPRMLASLLIHL